MKPEKISKTKSIFDNYFQIANNVTLVKKTFHRINLYAIEGTQLKKSALKLVNSLKKTYNTKLQNKQRLQLTKC